MVICKSTPTTAFYDFLAPFTLARVVEMPRPGKPDDDLLLCWWIPERTTRRDFRAGRKAKIVDLFAVWKPVTSFKAADLAGCLLPQTMVSLAAVLIPSVVMEEGQIPFAVFDTLRNNHAIDLTALSVSQTQRGNVYRNYCLMGAGSR
jgi:hypothetical protein